LRPSSPSRYSIIRPAAQSPPPLNIYSPSFCRDRDLAALAPWLTRAEARGLDELAACALSLRQDRAAVEAALATEWSNGQTEGQVTRLKLVKRQMYGRAKFDLLRWRVLHRAA